MCLRSKAHMITYERRASEEHLKSSKSSVHTAVIVCAVWIYTVMVYMVLRFFEHPKSWNQGTSSPFPTPHIQLVCARSCWLPCAASPSAIPALLWKVSCVDVEWHNVAQHTSPSHSKVFYLNWLRIPAAPDAWETSAQCTARWYSSAWHHWGNDEKFSTIHMDLHANLQNHSSETAF